MAVQIIDNDKGFAAILREVRKRGSLVAVGILGPKAAAPKRSKGKPAEGAKAAPTLAQVAAWNEFGTGRIPARSFIAAWFDENRVANMAFARELAALRIGRRLTYDQSLKLMGARAVGGIQKRIAAGISPANAPSTVARKGSSKPLVNTGQLRSSIAFKLIPFGG